MFILKSKITIGKFQFSGVNEVTISRSMLNLSDTATIKIPREGKILKDGKIIRIETGNLFNDGDRVAIELGYNDELHTEFDGFVINQSLSTPLEISCEGYIRQLRQNKPETKFEKEIKVSKQLALATGGTDITVNVADDFNLINTNFGTLTGGKICEQISKASAGSLSMFFIEPKKLWCGFVYVPYSLGTNPFPINEVAFKIGYNCIKDNKLKIKTPSDIVKYSLEFTTVSGTKKIVESDSTKVKTAESVQVSFIEDTGVVKKMANEKQYSKNYSGYEGTITGFLQPFCQPGYIASISDRSYKERDGKYLIVSTRVTFGMRGATREIGLGPLLGFNPDADPVKKTVII